MSLPDFSECKTVADTNRVFKDLFIKLKARHDNSVADQLRESHRRSMEQIIYELRATNEPTMKRERSDSDLHGPTVRNWAVRQGLVLPKGRINKDIKQAYRDAHSDVPMDSPTMPPDVPQMPQDAAEVPLPSAAAIRVWATLEGIVVGKRGRLHPNVIEQYRAAHQ